MKRCAGLAVVICMCALALAVCKRVWEPDSPEESAVSISRKGQISAWFVEEFAEDYYSLAELTRMAKREAAEYNAGAQGRSKVLPGKAAAVGVKNVELLSGSSGKIAVGYWFDSWESYTDFSGQTLFYGTVGEAAREGFDLRPVLRNVGDGSLSAGDQLSRATDKYLIITDVKANIFCPREVTHISEEASVNEDGSIDTSGTEGTVYILMR